jgi:peptidoglycan/LPS O-acetylase OafA/YrhL
VLFALGVAWTVWAMARSDINAPAGAPLLNALPAYFDQFALGMGLAVLSVWLKGREATPGVIRLVERRPGVAWLAALALWVVSIAVASDPGYEPMSRAAYLGKHLLFGAVAVGVLLPAVVGPPDVGAVRRLLASRTLLWLGLVSYGIYLYHQPVYQLQRDWGIEDLLTSRPLVALAFQVCAALAVTVVLAGLSYYIVERPALGLRRILERRPEATEDQPGAVSVPAEAPLL